MDEVKVEQNKVSKMSNKEILRRQLELLTEYSKNCLDEEIAEISKVMLEIVRFLEIESPTL